MNKAVLYLRSSKDRSDVSIDVQRRELQAMAKSKSFTVVDEYADAVESGKDDNRPAFQALLTQFKNKDRGWQYLLVMDTSRIARNQYLAHAVHYECDKRNIKILYSKMPETGSVVDVVIRSVMQAFDQLHSLMSKEKGLAGMAENVKQGFRAGGRAPLGYKLEYHETGAIRDGEPVTKSKLILSEDAKKVAHYFKLRANGIARFKSARESGLFDLAQSTLIGMEWNALTYAGHTVWNVQNERLSSGGYKGGVKRRPRYEWLIQHDTHPALINTDEAETILQALENTAHKPYKTASDFLLSGLMVNAEGQAWHGCDGVYYRVAKGKRYSKEDIESAIFNKVISDLESEDFIKDVTKCARQAAQPVPDTEIKTYKKQVNEITLKIEKLTRLLEETDSPRPILARIEALEKQRTNLMDEVDKAENDYNANRLLLAISEHDVAKMLKTLSENLDMSDRASAKDFINALVDKIELNATPAMTCKITYKISSGELMASPRGFEPRSPP